MINAHSLHWDMINEKIFALMDLILFIIWRCYATNTMLILA